MSDHQITKAELESYVLKKLGEIKEPLTRHEMEAYVIERQNVVPAAVTVAITAAPQAARGSTVRTIGVIGACLALMTGGGVWALLNNYAGRALEDSGIVKARAAAKAAAKQAETACDSFKVITERLS